MSVLNLRGEEPLSEEPGEEVTLPETPPGLDAIRAWLRKPRPWLHGIRLWIRWILSGGPEAWRLLKKHGPPAAKRLRKRLRKIAARGAPVTEVLARAGKLIHDLGVRISATAPAFPDSHGDKTETRAKLRETGETAQRLGGLITECAKLAGTLLSFLGRLIGLFGSEPQPGLGLLPEPTETPEAPPPPQTTPPPEPRPQKSPPEDLPPESPTPGPPQTPAPRPARSPHQPPHRPVPAPGTGPGPRTSPPTGAGPRTSPLTGPRTSHHPGAVGPLTGAVGPHPRAGYPHPANHLLECGPENAPRGPPGRPALSGPRPRRTHPTGRSPPPDRGHLPLPRVEHPRRPGALAPDAPTESRAAASPRAGGRGSPRTQVSGPPQQPPPGLPHPPAGDASGEMNDKEPPVATGRRQRG